MAKSEAGTGWGWTDAPKEAPFMEKLGNINNKYLYVILVLGILIPTITPLKLPVGIGAMTEKMYSYIDQNWNPGDIVFLPGEGLTLKDILDRGWMWVDFIRQIWAKEGPNGEHVRLVIMSFVAYAEQTDTILATAVGKANLGTKFKKGIDYINLGVCFSNDMAGYKALAEDAGWGGKTKDFDGVPLDSTPLGRAVKGYKLNDYKGIILIGSTGARNIQYQLGQWMPYFPGGHLPMIIIGYPMVTPQFLPYVGTGVVIGVTNGLTGAAEYDVKLNKMHNPYLTNMNQQAYAVLSIDPYNTTHLTCLVFLILGNASAVYMRFVYKKKEQKVKV